MTKIYELKHKKRIAVINLLIILLIVVSIFLLSFVIYLLEWMLKINFLFYVEFVLIIISTVIFARRKLIEFTYYLEKRKIRIDRIYSARPKLDLLIEFKNILYMGKYSNMPEKYRQYKKQMETFRKLSKDSFCIVHLVEKKHFIAVLSPSDAFNGDILVNWNNFINKK